ncbi:E2F-associated phosphoprotein-like isoform X2 [Sinocyclocheilus rhinocerous]|uniref:E2F-associated phosphoprotein-like n=1 Tax=Sinocyclocheilus rhinocerous TaxID=307959 RepID=A0A673M6M0_9TELE|nr:PREDICTED: E2F-associated phosphoprotein-like isoform X1 [Sinocyclocheilus rhinocerous]XP_016395243.1 PREDICTED: E2F-associated phosphoprotein-like isoform X2 [Sinocyclocheilus rhinocerous]
MNRKDDYDSYEIEEPSDEEGAGSSSEDELDILLNGTPEQKKKLIREYLTGESESSSGDEFEKEMEAELSSTMKSLECSWTASSAQGQTSGTSDSTSTANKLQTPEYDSIYFDSDEDEDGTAGSSQGLRRKQRSVLTNDELLYDPDEDDRDQAWVDAKRKEYRNQRRLPPSANRRNKPHTVPSSDAVLNCPACMTTLCLDCQRHERYRTQYRAMFVMNCTVNKEEVLRYKTANKRKQNRHRKKARRETTSTSTEAEMESSAGLTDARLAGMDEEEIYHPVKCTECSTEVAVYDKDEVYHFFNILASHC